MRDLSGGSSTQQVRNSAQSARCESSGCSAVLTPEGKRGVWLHARTWGQSPDTDLLLEGLENRLRECRESPLSKNSQ